MLAAAGSGVGDRAGRDAVGAAIGSLTSPPALLLAFPAGLDAHTVAADLRSAAAGAPTVGIMGNGAIAADGAIEHGCAAIEHGCAAIAFADSMGIGIGVARDASRGLRHAARSAAADALEAIVDGDGHPLLLLFLDTRSGDQAEAVAGAYEVAGPTVPIAGGAAGGEQPAQLVGGETTRDAVIAVAIDSPDPIGIGAAHGCTVQTVPAIVTRSQDRLLHELDGRPAAGVYLEKLGFADLTLSDAEFEAVAVTHPLAQPELRGQSRVRHVLGRDGEALVLATRIPANAAVEFTHETPEQIVAASTRAVDLALDPLPDRAARAALLFDCAGRKRAVAGSLDHEISALLEALPAPRPPLAGLFTHGEIARTRGAKGDLNHAVVAVAFG